MRIKMAAVLVALVALAGGMTMTSAAAEEVVFEAQVVAGHNAQTGAWPAMVGLVAAGRSPAAGQFCGGSLIAPEWVLTAAHCVTAPAPAPFTIFIGSNNLLTGGESIATQSVHVHPGWNPTTQALPNDIALVRLARPATQQPLDLIGNTQSSLWAPGTMATLIGWGGVTTDMENQLFPVALQEVQMPVVADTTCRNQMGSPFVATSMVCAGAPAAAAPGGPDACNGDSGGPLMVPGTDGRWLQIGIVSWGRSCGLTLSAYTEVAAFRSWIDPIVGLQQPVSFSDIAGNSHEASITAVAGAGIAGGFPDGTFRPGSDVTRGQMATFLTRALDLPAATGSPFPDIAGSTHEAAIAAVAQAGIAGGFGDGTYGPNAPVTRGQMATFLTRALHLAPAGVVSFSDVAGNGHAGSIASVAAAGIASGFSDGTYRPGAPVTRGQMATFLFRALLA